MDVDIKNLAKLARIDVPEEELAALEKEIPEILGFVDQVQEVAAELPETPEAPTHHNVMREDGEPHESGKHTEDLMEAAPAMEKGYLKVKQVLKK